MEEGRKTILIIDGLDHLPREYNQAKQSFLSELLLPNEIPLGVYIILGSQTYDLQDIKIDIKKEFQNGHRTVKIDALSKIEVYQYLEKRNISLDLDQKSRLYEKTQGHPLYLTYIVEKLQNETDINLIIDSFINIDGAIENYYNKIWEPVQKDVELIDILGLIGRINGPINLSFVKEWNSPPSVLSSLSLKAKFLFNQYGNEWTFFHNSFRQYLLNNTCLNILTNEYDEILNLSYHARLADLYKQSKVEPIWKKNFHLFVAEKYNEFLEDATPESFTNQLLNYRPIKEIKQDIKLGIEIARRKKDIVVLVRFLFALAEIERRMFYIDPGSLTEQLIIFKKISSAKHYIRTDNTLHCSKEYALKTSRLFLDYNEKSEGRLLFNLAYPEEITDFGIIINNDRRYEETGNSLAEWIYTAPNFLTIDTILSRIINIQFAEETKQNYHTDDEFSLRIRLLTKLGYSLIESNRWSDLELILAQFDLTEKTQRNSYFLISQSAIEKCLEVNDVGRANEYLSLLMQHFTKGKTTIIGKIYISDLIYKVHNNISLAYEWIKNVDQSKIFDKTNIGYKDSLDEFIPLIKFNKILNLSGNGIAITEAIPDAKQGSDEEVLVAFQRMLCLITQILCEGLISTKSLTNITRRVYPIVRFYYKDVTPHNSYWYNLTQAKGSYFDFLINSVSTLGKESVVELGDYLFLEFTKSSKYWPYSVRREVIKSLLECGYDIEKLKIQLNEIESFMLKDLDIDGRVNDCLAHADVWIQLEELNNAEMWIKRAIQESIGVGYRKDYQFSTWIEWLGKINKLEPESAPNHLKWFLSQLAHIKASTEGRAYWDAAEEILRTTFEWDFYAGFTQIKWQLEKALIDFDVSLSVFIEAYIDLMNTEYEFKGIINLYSDLLLFITDTANENLLNNILKKAYSILGKDFLKEYLPNLIKSIETNALEQCRFSMLTAIEEFCKSQKVKVKEFYPQFEIPNRKERESNSTSSNVLLLKIDHQSISEDEVFQRVTNFDCLKGLVLEEDQANSYFDWSNVLEKILPELNLFQIEEISELAKDGRKKIEFYSKLSEAAYEKNDKDLALSLAHKSLELSSPSGWVKYYDGGTRIKAFNAIKKIDNSAAIEKAFNVFCHDVVKGDYSSSYIEHLDDILPLLTDNFDIKTIWPEIFDYLKRLMSNSSPIQELPDLRKLIKPINEILIDYLIYLSNHPTFIIKNKAILLLFKSIEVGDEYALNQIVNSNIDSSIQYEIMMLLLNFNSDKLNEFKIIAQKFAVSQDYLIRKNACLILLKLNEKLPNIKTQVPSKIFYLHLPKSEKLDVKKELDPYYPKIDLNDPEDLVSPFGYIINILSEESDIDKANLYYRIHAIMKKIGNESEWSNEYEKNLRGYLEDVSLKFSYPRPRVITAKKSIHHLVSELVDSGLIEDSERILAVIRDRDYKVSTYKVSAKPNFIQVLKERDFGGVGNDWLDRISNSPRLNEELISNDSNDKIIGEYTFVKNLDWGSPSEIYMSQIARDEFIEKDDHCIFGSVFHRLTNNYYSLHGLSDKIIVVRDHRYNQFNLKSRWIAINPDLARFLGWVPEPNKLFGWKDNKGILMVESIYWSNGNIDMVPRKDSEVGEGWYIIVSKDGLSQIQAIEPNLYIQKRLTRVKYEESIRQEKTIFKVLKL